MKINEEVEREIQRLMIRMGCIMMHSRCGSYTVKSTGQPISFNFKVEQQSLNQKDIPGIFFNTLPKSGSIYLYTKLIRGLNIPSIRISGGHFPDDIIVESQLKELALGKKISQEHLPARRLNLQLLQLHLNKLIVHVRDPRQAVLSWVHFLEKEYRVHGEDIHLKIDPPLHPLFFEWSFEKRLDWYLSEYFHYWVQWIYDWFQASQNPRFSPKILFTQQKELKQNSKQLIEKILNFYEMDLSFFSDSLQDPKEGEMHFRKGLIDEWRDVFSKKQIENSANKIPKQLFEVFEWEP